MLLVLYRHPLHGDQTLRCKELVRRKSSESGKYYLHAVNIHGVTFQTLDPERVQSVTVEGAS